MNLGSRRLNNYQCADPAHNRSQTRKYLVNLISKITQIAIGTLGCLVLAACGNDTPSTEPTTKLQLKAVGVPLSPRDKAQDFFLAKDSIYVTQNNYRNGSFSFLKISTAANATTPYFVQELLVPRDQPYQIVGDLVVDPETAQPYMPVAIGSGGFYDYGWLQYPTDSKTPNNSIQGSYRANALFPVAPASFSEGKIIENYAGTLIAINQATGKEDFKKEGLLTPYQTNFVVRSNNLITTNKQLNGLDLINLETGVKSPIGSKWTSLQEKGIRVSSSFAMNGNTVYLLGVTENYFLTLCSTSISRSEQEWVCVNSENELPAGSQSILNLRFDSRTSSVFFLMKQTTGTSQIYRIQI